MDFKTLEVNTTLAFVSLTLSVSYVNHGIMLSFTYIVFRLVCDLLCVSSSSSFSSSQEKVLLLKLTAIFSFPEN